MATKRTAAEAAEAGESVGRTSEMTIQPLGAGNEVGRSCHIMKFKGKTIMVRLRSSRRREGRHAAADSLLRRPV